MATPSSPQVEDLDDDGVPEIVVTSSDSIYALRPDGRTNWRFTTNSSVIGAVAGDIDADGKSEVIATGEDGYIYGLNHDGAQLWGKKLGGKINTRPTIGNLDGQSKEMDILIGTGEGALFLGNGKGEFSKITNVNGAIVEPISLFPQDQKRQLAILIHTDNDVLTAYDLQNGNLWSSNLEKQGPVALSDIDFDGTVEVISTNPPGSIVSRSSNNGSVEIIEDFEDELTSSIVVDFENDGTLETILGDSDGKVSVMNHDGDRSWAYGIGHRIVGLSAVEAPEVCILAISENGDIVLLDRDGSKAWDLRTGLRFHNPASVADVDNDHEMEIIITDVDGHISMINTHQVLVSQWSMQNHDIWNTNSLGAWEPDEFQFRPKWHSSIGAGGEERYLNATVLGDLDGDGKHEVIEFWDNGSNIGFWIDYTDSNGKRTERVYESDSILGSTPITADVVEDDGDELIFLTNRSVTALRGDFTTAWERPIPNPTGSAADDIDDNGRYEVFIGTDNGDVMALNPMDGSPLWTDNLGSGVETVTTADLDNDGKTEAIFTVSLGIMYVLNANDGQSLWASDFLSGRPLSPVIGDFDGDSSTDIALETDAGRIYVYFGNGTKLWEVALPTGLLAMAPIKGAKPAEGLDLLPIGNNGIIYRLDGGTGEILGETGPHPMLVRDQWDVTGAYFGTEEPFLFCLMNNPRDSLHLVGRTVLDDGIIEIQTTNYAPLFGVFADDGLLDMVYGFNGNEVEDMNVGPGITSPWTMSGHDPGRTFNPLSIDGKFLPDLEIGPADITFDPPLINENGTVRVNITYHNKGSVRTSPFNITIRGDGKNLSVLNVDPLPPFSKETKSYPWKVGYENHSITIEIDPDDDIEEIYEDDNIATRFLFINLEPLAEAGPDSRTNPGEEVIFDGSLSSDRDGAIVELTWDFGDGIIEHGPIVSHSFNTSGKHDVTLEVTDNLGLKASDNLTVYVNYPPLFMDWTPKGSPTINEGEDVDFWVLATDPDGDPTTVQWFMDGIKVTDGVAWSTWANYSSAGKHEVKVLASDGNLTTEHVWTLTITDSFRLIESTDPESPVTIPEGQARTFTVELHPGAEGARKEWYIDGKNVQHGSELFTILAGEGTQGEYELTIEVIGGSGRDLHTWKVIIGPEEVVPRIRWYYPEERNLTTESGSQIWFGISSEGGNPQWFVDGAAVLGENGQSYLFKRTGAEGYTVTVRVSTDTASVSQSWNVEVRYPPTAIILASITSVKKGKAVSFDGGDSHAHGYKGNLTKFLWDFGDGDISTGVQASHRFDRPGTYLVTLNVTDRNGLSDVGTVQIVVKAEPIAAPGFEAITMTIGIAIAFLIFRRRRGQ